MGAYYEVLFGLSVLLTLIYIIIWHKHFDTHISLIFAFIPLVNLAYALMAHARTLDAALVAAKLTYVGGCFLSLFITQSIFGLCHINLKRWMSAVLMIMCLTSYAFALSMGNAPYFYKTVGFEIDKGVGRLVKTYGFAHTLTLIVIFSLVIISFTAMVYSLIKKKDVSNKTIVLLMLPATISFLSYFANRFTPEGIDAMPLSYVFAQAKNIILMRFFILITSKKQQYCIISCFFIF